MRILIDAMGAPAEGGGMNRYATEVVSSWVKGYPDDDLVLVPEGVVLLGEQVRHRVTGRDIRQKPERVLHVR